MLAIVGSVTPPGRLRGAVADAVERASGTLIDLADRRITFAAGQPLDSLGDDTAAVVGEIAAADAVLFATPTYRGSMTGVLKNLLDQTPLDALRGTPVGIVAMGVTAHHFLGADRHLRDVMTYFGAPVAPVSVYLTADDFTNGVPSAAAAADLDGLIATLKTLRAAGRLAQLPAPLVARERSR